MGKVITLEAVLLLYITTSGRVHSGKHDRGSGLLGIAFQAHFCLTVHPYQPAFPGPFLPSHKLTQKTQMNVCSFFNAFSSYSKRNKV